VDLTAELKDHFNSIKRVRDERNGKTKKRNNRNGAITIE
jgi:hypothetical protein